MNRLILIFLVFLIGCEVYPEHIKKAQKACADRGGLAKIMPSIGAPSARCVNGYFISYRELEIK